MTCAMISLHSLLRAVETLEDEELFYVTVFSTLSKSQPQAYLCAIINKNI
jgi:hypothetical protein